MICLSAWCNWFDCSLSLEFCLKENSIYDLLISQEIAHFRMHLFCQNTELGTSKQKSGLATQDDGTKGGRYCSLLCSHARRWRALKVMKVGFKSVPMLCTLLSSLYTHARPPGDWKGIATGGCKKWEKMSPILCGLSGSQWSMKEVWALLGVHTFSQQPDGVMARTTSYHYHHLKYNSLHWKIHLEQSNLKQKLCKALAR